MWSRIILGDPVVSHLVKKFPHSMRQSFITICGGIVFEEALDLSSDRILNE